jgi:alpha-tubulin suppressor-like RCC1 family protein
MPTLVTALSEEVIIDVSCGFNYTAAITKNGDLFTWYVRHSNGHSQPSFLFPFIPCACKNNKGEVGMQEGSDMAIMTIFSHPKRSNIYLDRSSLKYHAEVST